ncbi:Hypothetical predicted protein [Cloeon dipterum]|uniref:Uncharacterized protein n=1 Tax=Cloeon dipterum TaxID=197152 RepID=A0A8S1E516_9INSE|nr:Hypothetical predicted protein [Cloeon dipterum]
MNDNAADGTTMEPENQQKGRGMKRKFTERKNYFSGFCVVCEKELLRIRDHKEDTHKDTGEIRCYDVKKFNGRRIMAPIGVNLEQELKLCSHCQGVSNAEPILMKENWKN